MHMYAVPYSSINTTDIAYVIVKSHAQCMYQQHEFRVQMKMYMTFKLCSYMQVGHAWLCVESTWIPKYKH